MLNATAMPDSSPDAREPEASIPNQTLDEAVDAVPRYRTTAQPETLHSQKLALYCLAKEAEESVRRLTEMGAKIEVVALYDEENGHAGSIAGIQVVPVAALSSRSELTLIVDGKLVDRKWVRLAQHGIRYGHFATDPRYPVKTRTDPDYLENYRPRLERLFSRMADAESRSVLAATIRARVAGDFGFMRISAYPEYDHPIVCPQPSEVVFDLGMETAYTSTWFSQRVGMNGFVYGFEASPEHWAPIEADLAQARVRNVEMVKQGVWKQKGTLRFVTGLKGASRVRRYGDERPAVEIKVTDLDSFIDERQIERVDMLSFDIEGAEPEALQGAAAVIKKHRPKLQVSLYHKMEHLMSLPEIIDESGVPYRFYMGHHSAQGLETDLYALPIL